MFDAIAKPFGILMMALYNWCQNYGVAVILFAIVVKIILLPFQMKAKRGMLQQQRLQPKIKELEKKHGANKTKYQQEVQELYREEGVSVTGGCLWSFIPLPILLSLFQAIRNPLTIMMGVAKDQLAEGGAVLAKLTELGFDNAAKNTYMQIAQTQFISRPENFDIFHKLDSAIRYINYEFLGINLGNTASFQFWKFTSAADWLLFLIPVLAGGLAFLQSYVSQKTMPPQAADPNNPTAGTSKMMMFMGPAMTLYFGFVTPAALSLYWGFGTILDIARELWLTKRYTKMIDAEDAVRNENRNRREQELEQKRAETERLKAENKTVVNPNTSKKKQEIAERQEREARAAEYERANSPQKDAPYEPSREGTRRNARGRAYNPERYEAAEMQEAQDTTTVEVESESE